MSKVSQMKEGTATLIFIGPEDKRVMPEAQGIAYYKALRSQKKTFTSLYHYPGNNTNLLILTLSNLAFPGETHYLKEIKTMHHMLAKSVAWMKKYWKSYDGDCILPEFKTTTSTTTEKSNTVSGAHSVFVSNGEYFNAFVVLMAMQCFTLGILVQLK